MESRYPIRAVAKITGISLDTLRAWERRYQAVVPERTSRGRQYGPEQLDRLLLLKQLVERGHAIGGIASLQDAALRKLLMEPSVEALVTVQLGSGILAPVLDALQNFDAARAGDELSRLAAALAPRDFTLEVIVPLMHEVGTRWHDGELGIAQEHMISQILRNLLGGMIRLLRPADPVMKMVLATPAGESHEFGILAAAMLASTTGIEPIYLGPDLPAREIALTAEKVSARVVLLGIRVFNGNTAKEVQAIASGIPKLAELWAGGAGAAELNLPGLGRKSILLNDLRDFEKECRRWRRSQ